jgi:hypothetical protein
MANSAAVHPENYQLRATMGVDTLYGIDCRIRQMFLALANRRGCRKRRWPWFPCVAIFFLITSVSSATAQSPQFLPEIDTSLSLNSLMRASFQAKQTREGGDPTQAQIGPSVDFFLKPWVKLKNVTAFDLDDTEKRALVFSVGYRILPSPDASTVHRLLLVATSNYPLKWGLLLSDRNRADNDWVNGAYDWRYRNRLSLQKSIAIHSYHPKVYLRAEEFYESKYQKWSTTALYVGAIFPIQSHLELSPYYDHQNNTGKKPNEQLNQVGLIANFYFSATKR